MPSHCLMHVIMHPMHVSVVLVSAAPLQTGCTACCLERSFDCVCLQIVSFTLFGLMQFSSLMIIILSPYDDLRYDNNKY